MLEWSWQRQLSGAVRDSKLLLKLLALPETVSAAAQAAADEFPILVPHSFLFRMRPGDPADPLLRQVLARDEERLAPEGFLVDPVGDDMAQRAPGMLQKYRGRVLLITTGACAIHCRYCFRRHFPYADAPHRPDDWQPALDQIAADPTIEEVILSGGDPLVLSDDRLASLWRRLEAIPQLKRVRLHTRLPVVLPARVTGGLLRLFSTSRLRTVVVVHANHARELVDDCAQALRNLRDTSRILLFNQAVLLAGVNDSVTALQDLSEALIDLGIVPYYLHQLDRVLGGAHFEVPVSRGLELMEALRARVPGYALPRYVREVAGELSKRPLFAADVSP